MMGKEKKLKEKYSVELSPVSTVGSTRYLPRYPAKAKLKIRPLPEPPWRSTTQVTLGVEVIDSRADNGTKALLVHGLDARYMQVP